MEYQSAIIQRGGVWQLEEDGCAALARLRDLVVSYIGWLVLTSLARGMVGGGRRDGVDGGKGGRRVEYGVWGG